MLRIRSGGSHSVINEPQTYIAHLYVGMCPQPTYERWHDSKYFSYTHIHKYMLTYVDMYCVIP